MAKEEEAELKEGEGEEEGSSGVSQTALLIPPSPLPSRFDIALSRGFISCNVSSCHSTPTGICHDDCLVVGSYT